MDGWIDGWHLLFLSLKLNSFLSFKNQKIKKAHQQKSVFFAGPSFYPARTPLPGEKHIIFIFVSS